MPRHLLCALALVPLAHLSAYAAPQEQPRTNPIVDAYVTSEVEKMKKMPEEMQWTYFRTSTTENRMTVVSLALKAYRLKHGRYPGSLREVEEMLSPDSKVNTKDTWGNELRYVVSADGKRYHLVSAGSDGQFAPETWKKRGRLAKADEDAVVDSGEAVRMWDEKTRPGLTSADVARAALKPQARAHLDRADALVKAKDVAGAITAYVEAVKIDRRASDLETLNRYRAARYAVEDNPAATDAGRQAAAERAEIVALRQHLEIHPGDIEVTRELLNRVSVEEAEAMVASRLAARANDAELYAMRARVRARNGRVQDALADFVKAAELDAMTPERHYTAGVAAWEVATKEKNISNARKSELLRQSVDALKRAEELRDGYAEAMLYRSLVLKAQASMERDGARQKKLNEEADALRDRAREALRTPRPVASNTGLTPPPPPPPPPPPDPPLRAGGDVKPPVILTRVEPHYTGEGLGGVAIVEVLVDRTGRVFSAKLVRPLPHGAGEAALEAVRQWTFAPGTRNGKPVDVIFNVTVTVKPAARR